MISNQLVPAYKINITIEITSRHHVAQRAFSSRGENNYIVKMVKFRFIDTLKKSNVTWMSARVPTNNQFSFYNLLLNLVHIFFFNEFFPPCNIFYLSFETFSCISLSGVFLFSNLNKYFVWFKYTLIVHYCDENARVLKRDPCSFFYCQSLRKLHCIQD